jgi:hypothetical protein
MSFGTILGVAGTASSVIGQLKQGKQQKQIFEYNAALNRQQAQLIRQGADIQIAKQKRQKISFLSAEKASRAKSGVDARGSGSVFASLSQNSAELEFDILLTDFNARIGILNQESSARLNIIRGDQAKSASRTSAATTLLTQLSSFTQSGNLGKVTPTNPIQGPLQSDGSF